ncbi:MAG: LysR family transcriptional regulator [Methylobacteriaceae bacterium]|nr:LysR family transcriptional regulator [Methylobacteriaceae bacterium]
MNDEFSEIELRKLDLNLLLVLSALIREGSVSRAASRLYLGPSAISMALGRLRDALGDPILVRAGRRMEPTTRALQLWAEIEPALGQIERAVRGSRRFDPATAERIIRFAAPDDLELVLVPRVLERLDTMAPGVQLVVRPSDFRTLLGRLDDGDADLALSATPTFGLAPRHRIQPLFRETFSVLYDAARLGRTGALDLETYLATPHLLLSIAGDLRGPIDDRLAEMGRSREVLAALSHFPTLPFVLKRRRAIANVPSVAAHHYAEAYGLEVGPTPVPSPDFEVALAWHARTDADPAQIWFRELVASCVVELRRGVAEAATA